MTYTAITLVVSLLYSYSNTGNNENVKVINFIEDSTSNMIEVSYIKLETQNDNMIGVLRQVEIVNNNIVILDTGRGGCVHTFSISGDYIKKIGRLGRGPGEYISPVSFTIDTKNNSIDIADRELSNILKYELYNKEYYSTEKIPFNASCFEYLSDGNIVWNNQDHQSSESPNSYFIITDSTKKILNHFIDKRPNSGYITGPTKMIYKVKDEVYGFVQFDPFIYKIDKDGAAVRYKLQFDKFEFPPIDFLKKICNDNNYFSELENSKYISYHQILESDDHICAGYMVNKNKFVGLYDKKLDKAYSFTYYDFEKLIGIENMSYISGKIDDYFVIPLMIPTLMESRENGYKHSDELERLIDLSKPDDNPILLLFKLKS